MESVLELVGQANKGASLTNGRLSISEMWKERELRKKKHTYMNVYVRQSRHSFRTAQFVSEVDDWTWSFSCILCDGKLPNGMYHTNEWPYLLRASNGQAAGQTAFFFLFCRPIVAKVDDRA